MKRAVIWILLASLWLSACAEVTSMERQMLTTGQVDAGGGRVVHWANTCTACGADIRGGSGIQAGYLFQGSEKARGPGQEW